MHSILLYLALAAPAQSQGSYVATVFGPSGSGLVEDCRQVIKVQRKEEADPYAATECLSFISGVVDGGQFAAKGGSSSFSGLLSPGC
jgi:hypothetical protein